MSEQKLLENPYGEVYGYIRVSTQDQKLDRQIDAMVAYGVKESAIFSDKQSGKNFNRPEYRRMIKIIRKGDIIVIKSIDRLGRNYDEIIEQWRMITQDIGCGIYVIDLPILNTSGDPADLLSKFTTNLMLQVLGFVAQNERENTIKRQQEGLKAARKREKIRIGRPKIKIPFDFWEIYIIWKTGQMSTKEVAEYCKDTYNMSERTFFRRLREIDTRYGDIDPNKLRDLVVEEDFCNGIEFDMERCEAAIGYYNPYMGNTEKIRALNHRTKRDELLSIEENDKLEEEEFKKLVLEKRQADFRDRMNIQGPETTIDHVRSARTRTAMKECGSGTNMTKEQRESYLAAVKATSTPVKTTQID